MIFRVTGAAAVAGAASGEHCKQHDREAPDAPAGADTDEPRRRFRRKQASASSCGQFVTL